MYVSENKVTLPNNDENLLIQDIYRQNTDRVKFGDPSSMSKGSSFLKIRNKKTIERCKQLEFSFLCTDLKVH